MTDYEFTKLNQQVAWLERKMSELLSAIARGRLAKRITSAQLRTPRTSSRRKQSTTTPTNGDVVP